MAMFSELYLLGLEGTGESLAISVTAHQRTGLVTVRVNLKSENQGAFDAGGDEMQATATPDQLDAAFPGMLRNFRAKLAVTRSTPEPTTGGSDGGGPAYAPPNGAAAGADKEPAARKRRGKSTWTDRVERQGAGANPNDDPDFSWMKNRQQGLFD